MKNYIKQTCLFAFVITLGACSLIKDPTASNNFSRVKYNSHVKLAKTNKVNTSTVASVKSNSTESTDIRRSEAVSSTAVEKNVDKSINQKRESENVASAERLEQEVAIQEVIKQLVRQDLEKSIIVEEQKQRSLGAVIEDWWERDIEDWPWLEIVLALIAFLLIIMVVSILVSILGGLLSSLLGLILLLILAYILYTLWF